MEITLTEPNVLLLDQARYVTENKQLYAAMELRRLDTFLRLQNQLPPRMIPRRQPWREPETGPVIPLTIQFEFFVDQLPDSTVLFAHEDAQMQVFCNGQPLQPTVGKWFDSGLNFKKMEALQLGLNIIECRTTIHNHQTLENCFLLGDFGVQIKGFELHMTSPVRTLHPGSWTSQGLPFYSGAVDYKCPVPAGKNRVIANKLRCSYAVILEDTQRRFRNACDLMIPDGLEQITLRLYGSRRNSHGPFHIRQLLRYCNPSSFVPLREEFYPHWQLEEYGIF